MDFRHYHVQTLFKDQPSIEIVRSTSTEFFAGIKDESLDFVYIDADHTFSAVLADLLDSYRTVRSGGLVMGDDYSDVGWWDDGVTKAITHVLENFDYFEPLEISGTQFILRRN